MSPITEFLLNVPQWAMLGLMVIFGATVYLTIAFGRRSNLIKLNVLGVQLAMRGTTWLAFLGLFTIFFLKVSVDFARASARDEAIGSVRASLDVPSVADSIRVVQLRTMQIEAELDTLQTQVARLLSMGLPPAESLGGSRDTQSYLALEAYIAGLADEVATNARKIDGLGRQRIDSMGAEVAENSRRIAEVSALFVSDAQRFVTIPLLEVKLDAIAEKVTTVGALVETVDRLEAAQQLNNQSIVSLTGITEGVNTRLWFFTTALITSLAGLLLWFVQQRFKSQAVTEAADQKKET